MAIVAPLVIIITRNKSRRSKWQVLDQVASLVSIYGSRQYYKIADRGGISDPLPFISSSLCRHFFFTQTTAIIHVLLSRGDDLPVLPNSEPAGFIYVSLHCDSDSQLFQGLFARILPCIVHQSDGMDGWIERYRSMLWTTGHISPARTQARLCVVPVMRDIFGRSGKAGFFPTALGSGCGLRRCGEDNRACLLI